MDIPYSTVVRPDTGLTNPKLGVWLFLAAEAMLFGSLFSSYALLRWGAVSWPDQSALLNVPLAAVNTLVLLSSSATMAIALKAAKAGNLARARLFLALTLAAGTLFLVVKASEYADKLGHGLLPAANNFLGLYYAMTGLHALHLAGGIVVVGYLLVNHYRLTSRLEATGIYWHFVDAVWLLLFPVLYLL